MRKQRKNEHIENYLKTEYLGNTLFDDIILEHNPLPGLALSEIDTSTEFLGKNVGFPLIINSMTGGSEIAEGINRDLATMASRIGLPMAVGSQQIIFENDDAIRSFEVVREAIGDDGIVIGNLNANSRAEHVERAAEVIGADAMQLHLNVCQELVMGDGDRDFRGVLENIEELAKGLKTTLIVKEVGFGIPIGCAERLYDKGIRHVDIAGWGGTNFVEIENLRRAEMDFSDLYSWGNPTAKLLLDYRQLPEDVVIISSGGIRTGLDIVKSIVLGAEMVGISGEVLNYLLHGGYENAQNFLDELIYKTKVVMLLLGCKSLKELKKADYKVVGRLRELCS